MNSLVQNSVDGLSLGCLYAVIALGVALVFSVMRLVNFAHGELIMVGAYVLWALDSLPWPLMILGSVAAVALCAALMERLAFRPLRDADMTTLLVASLGVSLVLKNAALLFFGSLPKSITMPAFVTQSFTVGDYQIGKLSVITLVVTVATLIGLALFFKRTSTGIQIRAAANDFTMARLLGIQVNRLIALSFVLSGMLAGVAAVLLGAQLGAVSSSFGFKPVVVGFVAAVIGGMGSLPGAALGGLVLGVATVLLQSLLPTDLAAFRDAFLYAGVALILLVRPQGLLGAEAKWERI